MNLLNTSITKLSTTWALISRRVELFLEDSFFIDFIQKLLIIQVVFNILEKPVTTFSIPFAYSYVLNLLEDSIYYANYTLWTSQPLTTNSILYLIGMVVVNILALISVSWLCFYYC